MDWRSWKKTGTKGAEEAERRAEVRLCKILFSNEKQKKTCRRFWREALSLPL